MQYKVPQNVDIEDKVIGPLTIRQFIIILVAVGIIVVLNFIFVEPLRMIFYLTTMTIGGVAGIVAFAKYGDQNFEVFLISAFSTFTSPRKRIWKKEEVKKIEQKVEKPKIIESESGPKGNINEVKDDLSRLANLVDSGGYSTLDNGRITTNLVDPSFNKGDARDILETSTPGDDRIGPLMSAAEKNVPKREQLVSEVASVDPNLRQETPKIKLRGEGFE